MILTTERLDDERQLGVLDPAVSTWDYNVARMAELGHG